MNLKERLQLLPPGREVSLVQISSTMGISENEVLEDIVELLRVTTTTEFEKTLLLIYNYLLKINYFGHSNVYIQCS